LVKQPFAALPEIRYFLSMKARLSGQAIMVVLIWREVGIAHAAGTRKDAKARPDTGVFSDPRR
jgi:hypothetical protein